MVALHPIPEDAVVNDPPLHYGKKKKKRNQYNNRSSWHISFSGVVVPMTFITVTTLSVAGILIGMNYLGQVTSGRKRFNDVMILPHSSKDDKTSFSGDGIIYNGANLLQETAQTNDIKNSYEFENQSTDDEDDDDIESEEVAEIDVVDVTEEDDNTEHKSDRNEAESTDNKSDESVEDDGPIRIDDQTEEEEEKSGDMNTQPKHFNQESDDTRETTTTTFPRIISIEGEPISALNFNLRGSGTDTERTIEVNKHALRAQKRLEDSEDFSYRDPLYEGDCVPMQKWQETSFPNCNMFHELGFYGMSLTNEFEYLTHGGYNDIYYLWQKDIKDDPELAMKILQYGTEYSDRNYDRVRRDGLILERLTKSPYVLDTYGFCGFAVLTPYADGGTLSSKLHNWRRGRVKLTPEKRLQLAYEAVAGLAAVHDIDGEGLSSVAHGDLKGAQYLFLKGVMQLGDFNRGRFLRRNSTAPDTACTYTIGRNDAAFRSPEEYQYLPQTSAIDVYAVGSILYEILTGKEVWYNTSEKKAQKLIIAGELPKIDDEYLESTNPVDVALREAISMCYVYNPQERAKAADVAAFLHKKLSELPAAEE